MLNLSCQPASRLLAAVACAVAIVLRAGAAGDDLPQAESVLPGLEPILVGALAQSPRMISENLARLEAEYLADAARASLYPTAGGYARYQFQREDRLSSDSEATNNLKSYYSFEIAQPVFHWGSIKAEVDIARLRRDMAERNFGRAYQILASEIRATYLNLIIEKLGLRNARHELDRLKSRLEVVRQRIAEGIELAGTASSMEFAIEDSELALERMERGFSSRLRLFALLTGLESFSPEQVPETVPKVPGFEAGRSGALRTEYVTRRGYESDVRYANALRELRIQKLNLKIYRNALRPKFNLVMGLNQDEIDRTGDVENKYQLQALYAGVTMSWTIFDSYRARANTRAGQIRLRRQQRALEQTEEDLLRAIEQADVDLGFAVRALSIAERRWDGAVSSHTSAIDYVEQGRFAAEDVELARSAMLAAESTVCRARADCLNAITHFQAVLNADPLIERMAAEGKLFR